MLVVICMGKHEKNIDQICKNCFYSFLLVQNFFINTYTINYMFSIDPLLVTGARTFSTKKYILMTMCKLFKPLIL